MKSGFLDSLKLALSERFEVSDKDYKTLSDILLSKGLSSVAFEGGLVKIMDILVANGEKLPISINYLREIWEREAISSNFVSMIGSLVKGGLLSIRKVSKDVFLSSDNITKSENEDMDRDLFVVIYGTKTFNDVFIPFKEVLTRPNSSYVSEGVDLTALPKLGSQLLKKASDLLKNLDIILAVESFNFDELEGSIAVNLNVKRVSDYTYSDSQLMRSAKKYLKGARSIDIYKESKRECFLSFEFDNHLDSRQMHDLSEGIFQLFKELEVEGV